MDSDRTFARAPGALPLLGHALALWRRPLDFLAGLPAYGDLVEIRLGPQRAYLACHPDLVSQVLLEPRVYDKGGPLVEKARRVVGNGLGSSNWRDHKRQRPAIQPAFHTARMPGYVTLMGEETDRVLSGWRDGQTLDIADAMHGLLLRILGRAMFGAAVGETAVAAVVDSMPVIMRGIYRRMIAPFGWQERLPLPSNRRFEAGRAAMHGLIADAVKDRRAGPDGQDDLLSLVMSHGSLSDQEIDDQLMTLLIGGVETAGNALAWTIHLLSAHPSLQIRLYAEADDVLADGRPPSFDQLDRLQWTWRVLTESMRMYPPAWLLTRSTTQETELAGHRLPPGATVLYSPYALGRNPAIFADPQRFDPDRWLPERTQHLPRGAMVPFGYGNRKCIGDMFGQAEMTLILAMIAARWELNPPPGATIRRGLPRATLETGPLPMVCTRRKVGFR